MSTGFWTYDITPVQLCIEAGLFGHQPRNQLNEVAGKWVCQKFPFAEGAPLNSKQNYYPQVMTIHVEKFDKYGNKVSGNTSRCSKKYNFTQLY